MLQSILNDLYGVIEVRQISPDLTSRVEKLAEETDEFFFALESGNLTEIGREGADVCFVVMITLLQQGINPFAAMANKLDEMNRETPWRTSEFLDTEEIDRQQARVILGWETP